jgi:hypothetical protein
MIVDYLCPSRTWIRTLRSSSTSGQSQAGSCGKGEVAQFMSLLCVCMQWKVRRSLSSRCSIHELIYGFPQTIAEPMLYRHLGLSSDLISDWHHTLLAQSGEECHPVSVTRSRWYSLVAAFTLSLVIHDPKGTLVSGVNPTHLTASQHFAVLLISQADILRTVVIEESTWMRWPHNTSSLYSA